MMRPTEGRPCALSDVRLWPVSRRLLLVRGRRRVVVASIGGLALVTLGGQRFHQGDPVKSASDNLEHASVRQYCKAVRTPAIDTNFVSLAEQAVKENHTRIRYLEALLALECEERDRHAIANRIRNSQLPRMKTLEEFDFGKAPQIPAAKIRELAEGGYIERNEPVVLIGECGTGKSHLATGLCLAACRQKGRYASPRRQRWCTSWWKPNRTIRCVG